MPTLRDCLENPPVKDDSWDTCVRRSSLGIVIGGLLGGVSSLYFGPVSVVFSMSMCAAWAVRHCRSLFREQAELMNVCQVTLPVCPPCPSPLLPPTKVIEPSIEECEENIPEPCPGSTAPFSFSPVIPIPDRPFGNGVSVAEPKKDEPSDCDCFVICPQGEQQIQCTCPVPHGNVDKIPDFLIICTTPVENESGKGKKHPSTEIAQSEPICAPPPTKPVCSPKPPPVCTCRPPTPPAEPVCTCPPPEPVCTCPSPEPVCTCPSPEPVCTCPRTH